MKTSHLLSSLAIAFVLAFPAFAQSPDAAPESEAQVKVVVADINKLPEPMGFMKAKHNEANALNKLAPSADRDAKIKAFVDDLADYDDMAKRSLGDRWNTLSADKQAEFKGTFREMLSLMYVKKISSKSYNDDKKVEWDRVVKTKSSATVSCFTQQKDVETEVEFVLHPGAVSWKVYDILLDGASLAETYRKKYSKQLDEKGIDAILDDMKKEIKKLNS